MSFFSRQLVPKRLELLHGMIPNLMHVAVVWNPMNPSRRLALESLEAATRTLRIELQRLEVQAPEDFQVAFAAARAERSQALVVPAHPLSVNQPGTIADLAAKHGLPAIYKGREFTRGRRSHILRTERRRPVPPVGAVTWTKSSKGAKPGRATGRAAHQVRPHHQPQDRVGPRTDDPATRSRPGRRGHPVGNTLLEAFAVSTAVNSPGGTRRRWWSRWRADRVAALSPISRSM